MKKIHIAILAIGFVTGSVNAADFSFTGNFEHNDEVREFNFTVTAPTPDVTLRTCLTREEQTPLEQRLPEEDSIPSSHYSMHQEIYLVRMMTAGWSLIPSAEPVMTPF